MRTSTAERIRNWIVRNFAWIVLVQFIIMVLLLAIGGVLMLTTIRHLTVVGNDQLLANRAVIRCSLEETVEFDRYLADRFGIPIVIVSPNTTGIDCETILSRRLSINDINPRGGT